MLPSTASLEPVRRIGLAPASLHTGLLLKQRAVTGYVVILLGDVGEVATLEQQEPLQLSESGAALVARGVLGIE